MKIHTTITTDRLMTAIEQEDYPGFCVHCGEETDGVEPDAREYECEHCGQNGVYGAEELLFMV